MHSKESRAGERLKNHMMARRDRPVKVTERKLRFWWGVINKAVFHSQLPVPEFRVRKMQKSWGECWQDDDYVKIVINSDITSKELFIGTLAHEMVHQYQWHHGMRFNHVDVYLKWKKYFKKHYNIIL